MSSTPGSAAEMIEEQSGLPAILGQVSKLPEPVSASFLKTAATLLGGLTAFPAGWLRQRSQPIDDVTDGRSAVAKALAEEVAKRALEDAAVMRAAEEIYLPAQIRKARNLVRVVSGAAEHVVDGDGDTSSAAPPDDDWLNRFMRFAEDATSERLQNLFGRILAGEVVRPGSYSTTTLRIVSELDQGIATDFSKAWEASVGRSVDYSPFWHRGDSYSLWLRLAEFGLMGSSSVLQYPPSFFGDGETAGWTPMSSGNVWLMVDFVRDAPAKWEHIPFSRAGREIGSLLPKPNYEQNMRAAAARLPQPGLRQIRLMVNNRPPETLWRV